ncbi:MAG: MMPL family transporter [Thermodesulfobacteriota bacterium]|nr:MMPL family transporter [Thermodesulfobacteriota bacterium]
MVGGFYDLQGQLGQLIARSFLKGLAGLILFFLLIGALVSRSVRMTTTMVACLLGIPLFTLGMMGHLNMPMDIIASPAANISIALGIDFMIHLMTRVRRFRMQGDTPWHAWVKARLDILQPILSSMVIIAAGFGIFCLSSFPPTQRFGTAVVLGTTMVALISIVILPFGATAEFGKKEGLS